jgi:hypothetical protein
MKVFLAIWNWVSFGITFVLRLLVRRKVISNDIKIDIDNDGIVDLEIKIKDDVKTTKKGE